MRLFGTNGIREVVGEKMTPALAVAVAGGIARVAPSDQPIVLGWDGRTSSPAFASIVGSTLALAGHRVVVVGLLPTPAIQYNLLALKAGLGVIITASHNPPEFNGIKLIAADGLEVVRDVEERVEAAVETGEGLNRRFDAIGRVVRDPLGAERYIAGILGQVDVPAIARRAFTVVLDCGNGASAVTSPELLRRLGCRVITLNGNVDGRFPGHLSEPTEANLRDLIRTVPAVGADLGIAHDGDADRAVFVSSKGEYLPGERMLTLLAREAVRHHHGGVVVTPVSASQSVEDAVTPLGGTVVYTRVGSPVVTREMRARDAVFGGEENGGLIFPGFQLARDGAMTAAALLDHLARSGLTLEAALADVPAYALVKEKVTCPAELRAGVMDGIRASYASEGARLVTIDGLKVHFPDGWILLRPSGTEPLIRIFAEAKEPGRASALATEGIRRVHAEITRQHR